MTLCTFSDSHFRYVLNVVFVCTLQASVGGIRLLKKNEDANSLFPTQNTANKVHTLLISLFLSFLPLCVIISAVEGEYKYKF